MFGAKMLAGLMRRIVEPSPEEVEPGARGGPVRNRYVLFQGVRVKCRAKRIVGLTGQYVRG